MEPQDKQPSEEKPSKGYSKRPLWHWIVLYIVIGIIVYGGIYFFLTMNNNTTPGY
jgi:flagellar basal body-associated protein FliL